MPNEKPAVEALKELLPTRPQPLRVELPKELQKTKGQLDAFARVSELTEENRILSEKVDAHLKTIATYVRKVEQPELKVADLEAVIALLDPPSSDLSDLIIDEPTV